MGILNFSDSTKRHHARHLYYINHKIWFFPLISKEIISIDPQTNQMQYLNWADEDENGFILAAFLHQGGLYFSTSEQTTKFGKLDCDCILQYQQEFGIDEKIVSQFADETKIKPNPLLHKWSDCIISEGIWSNTLRAYFKYIQSPSEDWKKVQIKCFKVLAENSDGSAGEKIHQWMKKISD